MICMIQKFLGLILVVFFSGVTLALSSSVALSQPALVLVPGGRFDKSFNESAYRGAELWRQETGQSYRLAELSSETERPQVMRRLARAGFNPIVILGVQSAQDVKKVAPEYPETKFVIIDVNWLDLPNLKQISFAEHEGSYLVGILAAMASKTGTIGFIGGMDIPVIRQFACGYAQGIKSVKSDANILVNMVGVTHAAWHDPIKGGELARAQIGQGADVIFAAAGFTGIGVLQVAADANILSIGVDSNQNHIHPGQVLTSMLKRMDKAVYNAFEAGVKGFKPGLEVMDLANNGVDYALDENNASLITDQMKDAVEKARQNILKGKTKVVSYFENNSCPVLGF